ncbi:hypothetical protein Z517_09036 [Fonsecaea pedrosoi CBS 271.37]|uniref:polynucleotide adenylyltransferase n=1 Tax=Fonsecaea pedrosoi CBS 271.37 TaxID=1442368 RepID=A0A0D2EQL3_9EURO|nr:uncharacterized protein Z517_09036 [Fonsecaea pedrosoi CBS 271.37]KIW76592.1 hypothetical protein Z517_09036 [Fonsecaea pedrosoi CBS 271.37]
MDTPGDQSGFSPHVWNRLNEMAQQSAPRARGGRRGGSQGQPRAAWLHQDPGEQHRPDSQQHAFSLTSNPDSFPPLGAQPPSRGRSRAPNPPRSQYPPESQPQYFNNARHGSPREYQERARGHNHRGSRSFGAQQHQPQHHFHPEHQAQFANPAASYSNSRPQTHQHGQLYNPNDGMHSNTGQQQRSMRHSILMQADYLTSVGRKAYEEHKFEQEERDAKENFRRTLESIAKQALGSEYPDLQQDQIRLRCYGSLANGFALAGSDMDLLLSLPTNKEPETEANLQPTSESKNASDNEEQEQAFKIDTGRILEKAFLDHEYGARLITQTRVPILRICQNPTPELLRNLRENSIAWEASRGDSGVVESDVPMADEPSKEMDSVEQALTDLNLGEIAPARQIRRGNAGLEFTDNCGIQCDINFSNFVALHNSAMLRLYQSFDPRVREVGVFVKIWAKTRDINTPYRGTLSSYGWILMVLHYLMNVARPPVIPNLQHLAKVDDSWHPDRPIELFEGFDVRFVQDPQSLKEIREDMAANPNRESAGQLLRGFFQYYATYQGFHWTRDVISIRTKGGLMSKQAKGWTEAKWQQTQHKSVRLRYLLAIEDPFEVEHNVARTVGHHGIIAIRDEFRRAWSIINTIGTDRETPAEDFLAPVTERVDTLRKDLESRKERQMQMRQELEAKEKALLRKRNEEFPDPLTDGTLGVSSPGKAETHLSEESKRWSTKSKLTSTNYHQDRNLRFKPESWRHRRVLVESDDEEEGDTTHARDQGKGQEKPYSAAPPVNTDQKEGFSSIPDVLLSHGYNQEGNPVAWDISTQDGRWLPRRDQKMRQGTLLSSSQPSLCKLNEGCPYDPRRPSPYIDKPHAGHQQRIASERPPWPSSSRDGRNKGRSTLVQSQSGENKPTVSRVERGVQAQDMLAADVTEKGVKSYEADNYENRKVAPTGPNHNPARQSPADTIGSDIPWDGDTEGGRWLRWRDARIRAGKWQLHPDSRYAEIDLAFPYNPEMTRKELDGMNKLLRRSYKRSIYSSKQRHPLSRHVATDSPSIKRNDRASSSGLGQTATSAIQTDAKKSTEHTLAAENDPQPCSRSVIYSNSSPITLVTDKPPSADNRASHNSISKTVPTPSRDDSRNPDLDFLRSQRLAFFSKTMDASEGESDQNIPLHSRPAIANNSPALVDQQPQTPIEVACGAIGNPSHEMGMKAFSEKASNPSHLGDNESCLEIIESGKSQDTQNTSLEVPATLYPCVDSNERPRDEDPKIIPIPRHLGFRFDPRQMEDLAVIARGGNGCARAGAQFHIEEEYEWGGGGMMGWKTSSGPQLASVSGHHTTYEAGKGDEQGLLEELPRDVD